MEIGGGSCSNCVVWGWAKMWEVREEEKKVECIWGEMSERNDQSNADGYDQ